MAQPGTLKKQMPRQQAGLPRWCVLVVSLLVLGCIALFLAWSTHIVWKQGSQPLTQANRPSLPPPQTPSPEHGPVQNAGPIRRAMPEPEILRGLAKRPPATGERVAWGRLRGTGAALALAKQEGTKKVPLRDGVVILANRTRRSVEFTVASARNRRQIQIPSRDLTTVHVHGSVQVRFKRRGETQTYTVDPDQVYFFADHSKGLRLHGIGPSPRGSSARDGTSEDSSRLLDTPSAVVVPVKLLVDEEEPGVQRVWEARLRKRVGKASALLERACGVRLKVVSVGTWKSDNTRTKLLDLLRDFEGKVKPNPARLAVGFTSQLVRQTMGKRTLGGLRRPFRQHILVREWDPGSEPERLEVLLHELGHFLGACHSPEPDSVMRPALGDRRVLTRGFRIRFDPVNTLILNLSARELRVGKIEGLHQFRPPTRQRLAQLYREILRAFPKDPTPAKYLGLLKGNAVAFSARIGTKGVKQRSQLSLKAPWPRAVVAAIVAEGRANALLAKPLKGDALTERYVRAAARAALRLPPKARRNAFLLGVGVTLGDGPRPFRLLAQVETEEERRVRAQVVGGPTVWGRRDLCQHFMVSCALTELVGPKLSEFAGLWKEQKDSMGGSGFSFADLAANLAGIAFARGVREGTIPLDHLADRFRVADYALKPDGLKEGLSAKEFVRLYGSTDDKRFQQSRAMLLERIQSLPGYRMSRRSTTR